MVLRLLCQGGQSAYFGPRLADIDPTLTDAFIIFDELSYQVIYQYPRFLAKEMLGARDRVLVGLNKYLQLAHEERNEDAWFVKAMEIEMRAIAMSAGRHGDCDNDHLLGVCLIPCIVICRP